MALNDSEDLPCSIITHSETLSTHTLSIYNCSWEFVRRRQRTMYSTKYSAGLTVIVALLVSGTVGVDLTLEPGASGEDVALAVLRKLSRSGLFQDDYDLSFRSAYVGNKFSEEPGDDPGVQGMWQVTPEQLMITQTSDKLVEIRERLPQAFPQIPEWSSVSWESGELLKPLVNGVAFRMFLETFMEDSRFPPWPMLINQGEFYSREINSTVSPQRFVELVGQLETFGNSQNVSCLGEKDIVFVHDGSCTVYPENFTNTRQWMVNLLETFDFEDVRVGYVVYSSDVLPVFNLDNVFTSVDERKDAILNGTRPRGQYTRTDLGMQMGLEMFQNGSSLPQRSEVPRILVVVTDGQAVGPLEGVVNATLEEGIVTFAVGLSRSWVLEELVHMAQNHTERVIRSEFTFGLPQEHLYRTSKALCSVHVNLSLGGVTEGRVTLGDTRYFKFQVNGGDELLRLSVNEVSGSVVTFLDFAEPHPSGAVNYATYLGSVEDAVIPVQGTEVYIAVKGLEEQSSFRISVASL